MILPGADPKRARLISVIAATAISMACGTNVSKLLEHGVYTNDNVIVCLLSMGSPIRRTASPLLDPEQPHRTLDTGL